MTTMPTETLEDKWKTEAQNTEIIAVGKARGRRKGACT